MQSINKLKQKRKGSEEEEESKSTKRVAGHVQVPHGHYLLGKSREFLESTVFSKVARIATMPTESMWHEGQLLMRDSGEAKADRVKPKRETETKKFDLQHLINAVLNDNYKPVVYVDVGSGGGVSRLNAALYKGALGNVIRAVCLVPALCDEDAIRGVKLPPPTERNNRLLLLSDTIGDFLASRATGSVRVSGTGQKFAFGSIAAWLDDATLQAVVVGEWPAGRLQQFLSSDVQFVFNFTHSLYYISAAELSCLRARDVLFSQTHLFRTQSGVLPHTDHPEFSFKVKDGMVRMAPTGASGTTYFHPDNTRMYLEGYLNLPEPTLVETLTLSGAWAGDILRTTQYLTARGDVLGGDWGMCHRILNVRAPQFHRRTVETRPRDQLSTRAAALKMRIAETLDVMIRHNAGETINLAQVNALDVDRYTEQGAAWLSNAAHTWATRAAALCALLKQQGAHNSANELAALEERLTEARLQHDSSLEAVERELGEQGGYLAHPDLQGVIGRARYQAYATDEQQKTAGEGARHVAWSGLRHAALGLDPTDVSDAFNWVYMGVVCPGDFTPKEEAQEDGPKTPLFQVDEVIIDDGEVLLNLPEDRAAKIEAHASACVNRIPTMVSFSSLLTTLNSLAASLTVRYSMNVAEAVEICHQAYMKKVTRDEDLAKYHEKVVATRRRMRANVRAADQEGFKVRFASYLHEQGANNMSALMTGWARSSANHAPQRQ